MGYFSGDLRNSLVSSIIRKCRTIMSFPFFVSFPGEVRIDVNLQLVMDADFSSNLLNRSSSMFMAMEENIKTLVLSLIYLLKTHSSFNVVVTLVIRCHLFETLHTIHTVHSWSIHEHLSWFRGFCSVM